MNNRELQRELLEDGLPEGFQEQVLRRTIGAAQAQRRVRKVSAAAMILGAILLAVNLNGPKEQRQSALEPPPPPVATAIADSKPFELIMTAPMRSRISSRDFPAVKRLRNTKHNFVLLETTPSFLNGLAKIDDAELFRLLEGKAVALVKPDNGPAAVIILETDPETATASGVQ